MDLFTRDYPTHLTNNSNCLRLPLTTWSTFYSMSSTRLSSKLLMVFAFSLFSPVLDWPVYIFNCRHDNVCRRLTCHKSYNLCIYFLQLLANVKYTFASIPSHTIPQCEIYFWKYSFSIIGLILMQLLQVL